MRGHGSLGNHTTHWHGFRLRRYAGRGGLANVGPLAANCTRREISRRENVGAHGSPGRSAGARGAGEPRIPLWSHPLLHLSRNSEPTTPCRWRGNPRHLALRTRAVSRGDDKNAEACHDQTSCQGTMSRYFHGATPPIVGSRSSSDPPFKLSRRCRRWQVGPWPQKSRFPGPFSTMTTASRQAWIDGFSRWC